MVEEQEAADFRVTKPCRLRYTLDARAFVGDSHNCKIAPTVLAGAARGTCSCDQGQGQRGFEGDTTEPAEENTHHQADQQRKHASSERRRSGRCLVRHVMSCGRASRSRLDRRIHCIQQWLRTRGRTSASADIGGSLQACSVTAGGSYVETRNNITQTDRRTGRKIEPNQRPGLESR